jgi:hypothetical protein
MFKIAVLGRARLIIQAKDLIACASRDADEVFGTNRALS